MFLFGLSSLVPQCSQTHLGMLVIVLSCPWISANSVPNAHGSPCFLIHVGVLTVVILNCSINSVPDAHSLTHSGALPLCIPLAYPPQLMMLVLKFTYYTGTSTGQSRQHITFGTAHPSAASHSAQPTLGCLTRHSPPSAASLGTAHPRLPHSAQPTLGCLTWHSPPSAASHSAQPTLGCLTLGTAHPRLPHLLGHSKVLQHFLEQHSFISQMQLQIMYMLMHLMSIQSHPLTSSSSSYIVRLLTGGEYCSGLGFDSPVRVFIAPPTLSLSQHVAPTLSLDLLSSSLSNYLFIIIIIYCRYIISYSTVPLP